MSSGALAVERRHFIRDAYCAEGRYNRWHFHSKNYAPLDYHISCIFSVPPTANKNVVRTVQHEHETEKDLIYPWGRSNYDDAEESYAHARHRVLEWFLLSADAVQRLVIVNDTAIVSLLGLGRLLRDEIFMGYASDGSTEYFGRKNVVAAALSPTSLDLESLRVEAQLEVPFDTARENAATFVVTHISWADGPLVDVRRSRARKVSELLYLSSFHHVGKHLRRRFPAAVANANSMWPLRDEWVPRTRVNVIQMHDVNMGGYDGHVLYLDPTPHPKHIQTKEVHIFTDLMMLQERHIAFDRLGDGACLIGILLEPPSIYRFTYDALSQNDVNSRFDHVLTFDLELANSLPSFSLFFNGGSSTLQGFGLHGVTSQHRIYGITLIDSGKRLSISQRLRGEIWNRFKTHTAGIQCFGYGCTGERFMFKGDILPRFRFAIICENYAGFNSAYFSEKIVDALLLGIVPIYFGNDAAISSLFDARGIIPFDSIDALGAILDKLGTRDAQIQAYNLRREAIERNRAIALEFADMNVVRRLAARIVGPNGEVSSLCDETPRASRN